MKTAMALVLAAYAGAAAAGDLSEPRLDQSNDYSGQLYYRLDFGGQGRPGSSLGLRFDSVRAQAAGAPSLLKVSFGRQGLDSLAVSGVDLRGAMLSANEAGGAGFFSSLSAAQWVSLTFTVLVFGTVAADAADTLDQPSGSGSGGG